MDDLVERLRQSWNLPDSETCAKAADEIERLREELTRMLEEARTWNREVERLRKELDTLKDLHQAVTNANVDLCTEKAALNDWVQGQAIDIRDYKDEIDRITKAADEQAQTLHDTICSANRLSEQLSAVTKERDELKHDLERHIAAYSEAMKEKS